MVLLTKYGAYNFRLKLKHNLPIQLCGLTSAVTEPCTAHTEGEIPYSCFFEVLKFHEWLIFGFFTRMGLSKAHTLQWVVGFFRGVKFHK